jgi:hypothetical protein
MQQLQQQQQQQAAADAAGAAPRTTAASTTSSGSRSNPTSRETQDSAPAAAGAPPVSGSSSPNKRPKQHQQSRRTYMQATCALYHRNQSAEAKEAFHGLVEDLLKPCSLFDEADVLLLKQLVLELAFCPQEQLSALQQQFFSNKQVRGTGVLQKPLATVVTRRSMIALLPKCSLTCCTSYLSWHNTSK